MRMLMARVGSRIGALDGSGSEDRMADGAGQSAEKKLEQILKGDVGQSRA